MRVGWLGHGAWFVAEHHVQRAERGVVRRVDVPRELRAERDEHRVAWVRLAGDARHQGLDLLAGEGGVAKRVGNGLRRRQRDQQQRADHGDGAEQAAAVEQRARAGGDAQQDAGARNSSSRSQNG